MTAADLEDLRETLDHALAEPAPDDPVGRAKHRALVAAILCEAFGRLGTEATLVGGGAMEFHAPGTYATDDMDLVVVGRSDLPARQAAATVFRALDFASQGRHWVRAGLFVEVPGISMEEPVEQHVIGGCTLRVVKPEVVLADRIVGFKHWRYTAYGLQAIAMVAAFRGAMDEPWLLRRLEREQAVDAYRALCELETAAVPITDARLRAVLERLEGKGKQPSRPRRAAGRKKRR